MEGRRKERDLSETSSSSCHTYVRTYIPTYLPTYQHTYKIAGFDDYEDDNTAINRAAQAGGASSPQDMIISEAQNLANQKAQRDRGSSLMGKYLLEGMYGGRYVGR